MNLIDALRHHARIRPFDLAVIHPSGSANFVQLAAVVSSLAARLRGEGLARGATAAVYVADPFLHLGLVLAAMVNGVRTVSGHPNYDPIPAGLAIDRFLSDRPLPFAGERPVTLVAPNWVAGAANDLRPTLPPSAFTDPDEVFRLYTSSGTTGLPKVIGHSLANLEAMATRAISLDPQCRGPNLCMMWLSTIGGFGTAHLTLWHGATLVLATAPLQVLRSINLYKVAMLRASPQQLQGLVEAVRGWPVRFHSLEKIEVGGAATPAPVLLAARALLCPNVVGIYGSTEAGLVAQAPASVMQQHPDAAGYVVPDAQVRIVNDQGQPLPHEQEGIVQIRTPYMVNGYVGDAAATAAGFQDGWFVPGDLGALRADGLLHIRGRVDEMINAGGVKLSPALVDETLLTLPGVRDAATFAHRQPGQYDQVWAAVVCGPEFDEAAVLAAARARLNSRAPVRLVRVQEIPRNAMGKAMRQQLSQDTQGQ
jgi:acyl-coenzyme A synthetase/AMP-(fatty) acid ligase